jgi:hypothetical protein
MKSLAGKDNAAKKRRAFVTVRERAIGADLEGKIDFCLRQPLSRQRSIGSITNFSISNFSISVLFRVSASMARRDAAHSSLYLSR